MYILAVDTTAKTAACTICKDVDGKIFPICSAQLNSTMTHSESMLPMVDFCLKNSKLSVNDVDLFSISSGPGSFTGVRIGISSIKGLAFGRNKKCCLGVSTLEALSYNLSDSPCGTIICPCMDARRQQFYNAVFESDGNGNVIRLCEDRAIDFEELFIELKNKYGDRKILLLGDGAEIVLKLFSGFSECAKMNIKLVDFERRFQNAVAVAKCGFLHKDECVDAEQLSPVYLRMSQAERERNEKINKE